MDEIVNRVAKSSLITIDLKEFEDNNPRTVIDLKDQLYQGIMLREANFRAFVKEHNWAQYEGHHVALTCTADAIIPNWAYMILATSLAPYVRTLVQGNSEVLERAIYEKIFHEIDIEPYRDKSIVLKGCSGISFGILGYMLLSYRLVGVSRGIMYGEACSSVPVYKRFIKKD